MLGMAHMTLSVPDDMLKEMKKHPEIKWTEVARQSFLGRLRLLKGTMTTKDFFKLLSPDTQKSMLETDEKGWTQFSKKMRQKDRERARFLIQA